MGKKRATNPGPVRDLSKYNFGLDLSLRNTVDQDAFQAELQDALLGEAFRRGATVLEAFALLSHLRGRALRPEDTTGVNQVPRMLLRSELWPALPFEVEPYERAYREQMIQELDSLPDIAKNAFGMVRKKTAEKDNAARQATYLRMRAVYYQAGYDDPAETIFRHIVPGTLLGKNVRGGVHAKLKPLLDRVGATLDGWSPGLSQELSDDFETVGGFVPRFIEGTITLSNHAFGLAIDIDAPTNPHIKAKKNKRGIQYGAAVILNKVVADKGVLFDYLKEAVPQEKGVPAIDHAMETYNRAQNASRAVQEWLNEYLPLYERPDVQAVLTGNTLDPSVNSTPNLSLVQHENLKALQELHKYHKDDISKWRQHGLQTLPLYLVVALVNVGLKWGQCYKSSKDAMHFELEGAIKPESKKRPLSELFQITGAADIWRLQLKTTMKSTAKAKTKKRQKK